LAIDVRAQSGETTFLRRGAASASPQVVATVSVDIPVMTITDDGIIYYESPGPSGASIATVGSTDTWSLGHDVPIALDWTTAGLIGLLVDTGSPAQDAARVAHITLGSGPAQASTIEDVQGTVDFGLATSPDGTTLLVGTMTDIGSPVRFTLIGPGPTSLTVDDARPRPLSLWTTPNATYVFYLVGSEPSVASRSTTGAVGPSIDLGFDESALAVATNGTYAVASANGVLDVGRICVGAVAPPA
jgi:hypothetical protein